jgi:hypothetical protein
VDAVFLPDTEEAYAAWVKEHHNGYIMNLSSGEAVKPLMVWHQANCGHIQPDGKLLFVEGQHLKACCDNPGVLAVWAVNWAMSRKHSQSVSSWYCVDCRIEWNRVHG